MDFRGHGRSGGLFSFSAYEQADLNAVLDWVGEPCQRVGVGEDKDRACGYRVS